MTLQERMQAVIDYSGLSIPQLAKNVGFKTPQTIREILKGNTRSISDAVKLKLISYFPNISPEWLTTGEGQMLKSSIVQTSSGDNSPNINGNGNHVNTSELLGKALDEIAELRKINQEQVHNNQAQFDRFMTIIEHLTNKD